MENDFSKADYLKTEFNGFWQDILGEDKDYFTLMTAENFDVLKAALSNINNIITFNTTINAIDSIGTILKLNKSDLKLIKDIVNSTKPNDNGYDIEFRQCVTPFICEVKCNRPINGGNRFGSAQKNGITKDLKSLIYGKSKSVIKEDEINDFYKFMVIYEFDSDTTQAVTHYLSLLKDDLKERVKLYKNGMALNKDEVYVILVK